MPPLRRSKNNDGASRVGILTWQTLVVIGTILATATLRSTGSNEEPAPENADPSISTDGLVEGQNIENPIERSGRFEARLRPGESLWVLVGNVTDAEQDPTTFYLQQGPCINLPTLPSGEGVHFIDKITVKLTS